MERVLENMSVFQCYVMQKQLQCMWRYDCTESFSVYSCNKDTLLSIKNNGRYIKINLKKLQNVNFTH